MRQRTLLLLVAALALAALVAVLVGSDGESGASSARAPVAGGAPAETTPAPASLAVPAEEQAPLRGGPDRERRTEMTEAGTVAAELSRAGASRWIEGRIVPPGDAPDDPTLRVLVLAEAPSGHERYGHGGFLAAPVEDLLPSAERGLWSLAEVDAGGRFRAAVPADAESVVLDLAGRYLYLEKPVPVEPEGAAPELVPSLGTWVVGRLVPPAGSSADLEGIEVELGLDEMTALFGSGAQMDEMPNLLEEIVERHTRAGADGAFAFRGVPPLGSARLSAVPESLAFAVLGDLELQPGERKDVELELMAGATLSGHARDEAGQPVAGAEVRAHQSRSAFGVTFPAQKMRSVETDAEGAFELRAVTPGQVDLVVDEDGYLESVGNRYEVADGEHRSGIELVLSSGLAIQGTVHLPDGRPAAGARVDVERDFSDFMSGGFRNLAGLSGDATADDEGRFRVGALGKATFQVKVHWSEEDDDGAEYTHVTTTRAGGDPLAIVLEPPIVVRGRVVDEAGEPIPEFRLRAFKKAAMAFLPASDGAEESFESEDGTFEWTELHAGEWTLEALAEGYSPSEAAELRLPEEAGEPVELVLPRSTRVSGRVVDPTGAPAAGAEVTLVLDLASTIAARTGQREFPTAETDERGRFTLELSPGEQSVVASHPDWANSPGVSVEGGSGEEVRDVVLALRRGARITGEIFDEEGEHAAGAQVIAQRPDGTSQRFGRSDGEGFFRFERLTPGNWQLVGMLGDGALDIFGGGDDDEEEGGGFDVGKMMSGMRISMVEVADEEEKHVLLGAPPEDPVLLRGRVVAGDAPLSGAVVSFFPAEPHESAFGSLRMTQTDSDGRFEFELDEPGAYLINVQDLVSMTGQQQTVEFRENVPAEEVHEIELEMPGGSIRGRVYGPGGEPSPGARVSLTGMDGISYGSLFGGQYADVLTDDNGEYALRYLRSGTYSVGAGGVLFGGAFGGNRPEGREIRSGIHVGADETVRGVDFHLEGAGRIHGVVRDRAGRPVPEATIFLRDEEGALLELFSMVATDASGRFQYAGVSEGRYTVTARTGTLVSAAAQRVEVEAGETTRVELTASEGAMLVVSLIDKTGAEVEARIQVIGPDGREWNGMMSMQALMELMQTGVETTAQRVGPLVPGTYQVTATSADGRTASKGVSVGGGGERKLKLRLRD